MDSIKKNADPYTQPMFSLGNRTARAIWNLFYTLFFRYTPIYFHGWRRFLLKFFGAKIGKHCHVYPKAKIWAPWNLIMEDYACLGNNVNCYNVAKIKIGKKSIISQGVHLCSGTHNYKSPNFQLVAKPIRVGEKAWICAEAFVHSGVNIGEGAVIGARSVVTKDMPKWTVCSGFPCWPIKKRELKNE
jgi:putative colanic acid biosynthesis acetyltransferase WcaF